MFDPNSFDPTPQENQEDQLQEVLQEEPQEQSAADWQVVAPVFHIGPETEEPMAPAPEPPKAKKEKIKKEKRPHVGLRVALIAICCALIGSAVGGVGVGFAMHRLYRQEAVDLAAGTDEALQQTTTAPATEPQENTPPAAITLGSTDTKYTPAQVYANNVEAVVGVSNEVTTNIFGYASSTASVGTGFIISENGEILTNYHVVEGAQKLTITLYDGREFQAEVLGYEADSDVALLKIDATGLPYVTIGDSDKLQVGDEVAAIGNPLGELTYTMTVGYVSALDRIINTDGTPTNMMQVDAAINSGNSGGPLFDMNGNVIGITTAKYSGTSTSGASIEGIGFAIPMSDVLAILDDLRTDGTVLDRAYMGVNVSNVEEADAEIYGLPQGVLIISVDEGGSAEAAGVRKSDIITAVDGLRVKDYNTLASVLRDYRAGDEATLSIWRSGQELELTIVFDSKPQVTATMPEQTVPESTTSADVWPEFP